MLPFRNTKALCRIRMMAFQVLKKAVYHLFLSFLNLY